MKMTEREQTVKVLEQAKGVLEICQAEETDNVRYWTEKLDNRMGQICLKRLDKIDAALEAINKELLE